MSVTIWQFILAALLQMMSVLGHHTLASFCWKRVDVPQFLQTAFLFLVSECSFKALQLGLACISTAALLSNDYQSR